MSAGVSMTAAIARESPSSARPEFKISGAPTLVESARELWSYRELLFFLAWRDVTIRYRQTLLGAAWAVLQPLATMAVFTVLFGRVIKVPTGGIPTPLFYLSALLPWIYFSTTLTTAGNSLLVNAELLRKVYFPRIILPASGALIGLVAMTAWYGLLGWRMLLWIPLTALLWLFAAGVGAFLAAFAVKYRDVKHAIPFVVQIWFFLTPIIYPASAIPRKFATLALLNPLGGLIEAFRAATTPSSPVSWGPLGTSAGLTLLVVVVSFAYFRRAEGRFTDIV